MEVVLVLDPFHAIMVIARVENIPCDDTWPQGDLPQVGQGFPFLAEVGNSFPILIMGMGIGNAFSQPCALTSISYLCIYIMGMIYLARKKKIEVQQPITQN